MALYQVVNGAWVLCQRPYVNVGGVWTAVTGAYIKSGGDWAQGYIYDVVPPDPPEISLEIVEQYSSDKVPILQSRWIRVGTRQTGITNDPNLLRIRMLTTYNGKAPVNQFGGTFTQQPADTWPSEPWSEWRYNDFGAHRDTSGFTYKAWPRNPGPGTILKGDTGFFFSGWSQDVNGNWSDGTSAFIKTPKDGVQAPPQVNKEARFNANTSGSWRSTGYVSGDLIQQNVPRSVGLWFYGEQISESIGADGTPTIRSAQIYVFRDGASSGEASANIYLYWHGYPTTASLPSAGSSLVTHEVTSLGVLSKGQGKWFDLPSTFYADLNSNIKGMGLSYKDPNKFGVFPEDYSDITSVATNLHSGELHVVWVEAL